MRRVVLSLVAVLLLAGITPRASAAQAASFVYRAGYSVQSGWLCYGWSNGAYHCTQHWVIVTGRYVSYNPAWVPSQGGVVGLSSEREPDGDADDGALVRTVSASGSVANMITATFGGYTYQAIRVATCESSLNPNAYNRASGASGVFQFIPSTWAITPYHAYSPFNAWANVQAAHWLFAQSGYTWRQWSCGYILGYV